ncbi:RNA dependent RNA polymerase-domain-containing protein [Mycena amicta]|nr:RNA dependent RNA polymerase-domain-containing protein [Mycena amicta]
MPLSTEYDDSELWSCFEDQEVELWGLPSPPSESSPLKRKFDTDTLGSSKAAKLDPDTIRFMTSTASDDDAHSPFFIAGFGDSADQERFETVPDISAGVKWEIARLVSRRAIKDVSVDDLGMLKGSSRDAAPLVAETLCGDSRPSQIKDIAIAAERRVHSPWTVLDVEVELMSVNPNANLGNSDFPGYGGKVCFVSTLAFEASTSKFSVHLERCTIGPSCRLYRQYGSSSFLRIRVPSKVLHCGDERLQRFFQRPFVIFDSVFRAFYSKEGRVILFKTREKVRNNAIETESRTSGQTLFEFLDSFNPLLLNQQQPLCKWASRFALGLSTSVPGPILLPNQAEELDDIVSQAESVMTDGCGLSNMAFNLQLQRDFKLDTMPCAVQVRHGGRKVASRGMLLVTSGSPDTSTVPRAAFRNPSQVKIVYNQAAQENIANATVDLLRFSRTKTPAHVFVRLQESHLALGVEDMLLWAKGPARDGFGHMQDLYRAVEKSENVYSARRFREVGGEARIHGFEQYGETEDMEDDSFEDIIHAKSAAWWPDYISGSPSSLAETVMALLDSGFTPQSLPVLRDKLKQIVRSKIIYRTQTFNFDIQQSAGAFVVPDYLGVLGPEEIHFKSSKREFFQADGFPTDIVLGDVLMTRNPCKVPSDVRKVKAVRCRELYDVVDVIVCSVKGPRRLVDFLAGGDYDGDKCIVVWDPDIVVPFRNASDEYSVKPDTVEASFTRDTKTVADFLQENLSTPSHIQAECLQKYLLGALRDPSAVGQYSGYHDNAVLINGYDHPQTIKLAYQFCTILDSAKTGYIIKQQNRKLDSRAHAHAEGPAWKSFQKPPSKFASASNVKPLERCIDLSRPSLARPFIMDVLSLFRAFDTSSAFDLDLAAPWDNYAKFAADIRRQQGDPRPQEDLDLIAKHVQHVFTRHRDETKNQMAKKASVGSEVHGFTNLPIEVRQDTLRNLSRDFCAGPSVTELQTIPDNALIARLRASYAYRYDHEQHRSGPGWSRFPWNVCFRDLCDIKAASLGPHKTVTTAFYENFRLFRRQTNSL